jgi:CheY-like chemotaxis protein
MTRQVLNVGQCGPDHVRISRMLREHFDVDVVMAETHDEAMTRLRQESFDLVLLNRIYDATGSQGMDTLRALKSDEATREIPVMIVSNYEDAQEAAVAEGAVPGFGKASLDDPRTAARLQEVLGS